MYLTEIFYFLKGGLIRDFGWMKKQGEEIDRVSLFFHLTSLTFF